MIWWVRVNQNAHTLVFSLYVYRLRKFTWNLKITSKRKIIFQTWFLVPAIHFPAFSPENFAQRTSRRLKLNEPRPNQARETRTPAGRPSSCKCSCVPRRVKAKGFVKPGERFSHARVKMNILILHSQTGFCLLHILRKQHDFWLQG